MTSYKGYYIVSKRLPAGEKTYYPGEVIKVEDWQNWRSLINAGYIREPNSLEDAEKIVDYSEGESE